VAARSQLDSKFRRDDARPAIRGVARDPDFHEPSISFIPISMGLSMIDRRI